MPRIAHGDVRQRILKAAEERLWHYGFKKTTIDEIAADAGVGKGTVYLYFDSKEDIALAIMAQYKTTSLEQSQAVARDLTKSPIIKLKEMLLFPILSAHDRCANSPSAQELIVVVKTHIQARLRPYFEQEIAMIAEVLEEGNQRGIFAVPDTMLAARTLKYMVSGFLPPYPCISSRSEIEMEIMRIVDLAVHGLRKCASEAH